MYCPNCGKFVEGDGQFCPVCGAVLPGRESDGAAEPAPDFETAGVPVAVDSGDSSPDQVPFATPFVPTEATDGPSAPSEPFEAAAMAADFAAEPSPAAADADAPALGSAFAASVVDAAAPAPDDAFAAPAPDDAFAIPAPANADAFAPADAPAPGDAFAIPAPEASAPSDTFSPPVADADAFAPDAAPAPAPGDAFAIPAPADAPAPAPGAPIPAPTDAPAPGAPAPGAPAPGDAPPPPEPAKKKSRTPVIIVAVIAVLALAIGGGFGIYSMMRSNKYNGAIETFDNANAIYSSASSIPNYEEATELYLVALADFESLGDYEEAPSYANRCSEQITLCDKNIDYLNAEALFDAERYADALSAFKALGSFKDSSDRADECQLYIDYAAALALYDEGKWDEAAEAFQALAAEGFLDADDWVSESRYAKADELYNEGKKYDAWKIFSKLGSFKDSADRANACKTSYPGTGELYHNGGYNSWAVELTFNGSNLTAPRYILVYDGDTLVSKVWLNAGGSATIGLPAGTYTFKQAGGTNWFGEEELFGDEGSYGTMVFDGKTSTYLQAGYGYTITLNYSGGNVGQQGTTRDGFLD